MSKKLSIAESKGGYTNTSLQKLEATRDEISQKTKQVTIGAKDGSYFVRCLGKKRNNQDTTDTASLLILDGDSRISADGEIISGAPNPKEVHNCLKKHKIPHVIYSSHSNGENFHKYRVIIFIEYSREQLHVLLEYFHELLHNDDVRLFNVKENRSWSQPWYYPRCPKDKEHLFKHFNFDNGLILDTGDICKQYEAGHPQIKPEPPQPPHKQTSNYTGGKISPIRLFNEHWKSPVYYLMTRGYRYKEKGSRLAPPHCKPDTVAGVQICRACGDGVERVYSHHGNDDLNDDYAHDSFDCFKILEHAGDETNALKDIGRNFKINGITLEKYNQRCHATNAASPPIDWLKMELE